MSDCEYTGEILHKIRIGNANFGAGVPINTALKKAERDFKHWESGESDRMKSRANKMAIDVAIDNAELQAENERLKKSQKDHTLPAFQKIDELQAENERLKSELDACSEACKILYADKQKLSSLASHISTEHEACQLKLEQYESTPERGLKAVMGFHDAQVRFGRESDKYAWCLISSGTGDNYKKLAYKSDQYQETITAEDIE